MSERTQKQTEIKDRYELTNFLLSNLSKGSLDKLKLGDTYFLNNYLSTIKKLNVSSLKRYIEKINADLPESVTDQLLNMLLVESYEQDEVNIKSYFTNLHVSEKKASAFESFVKCWIILERAVRDILKDKDVHAKKYLIPNFDILKGKEILTIKEAEDLKQLRQIRNYLLHGLDTPAEEHLQGSFQKLKAITVKVVEKVPTKSEKTALKKQLEKI